MDNMKSDTADFKMRMLLLELVTYLEEETITPKVRAELIETLVFNEFNELVESDVKQLKRL
tara:strand:- start:460 stop:642 length:183 start_codon:yes stop_codon:yes gene_type:complete